MKLRETTQKLRDTWLELHERLSCVVELETNAEPAISDLEALYFRALEVMGSPENALIWLTTPKRSSVISHQLFSRTQHKSFKSLEESRTDFLTKRPNFYGVGTPS